MGRARTIGAHPAGIGAAADGAAIHGDGYGVGARYGGRVVGGVGAVILVVGLEGLLGVGSRHGDEYLGAPGAQGVAIPVPGLDHDVSGAPHLARGHGGRGAGWTHLPDADPAGEGAAADRRSVHGDGDVVCTCGYGRIACGVRAVVQVRDVESSRVVGTRHGHHHGCAPGGQRISALVPGLDHDVRGLARGAIGHEARTVDRAQWTHSDREGYVHGHWSVEGAGA